MKSNTVDHKTGGMWFRFGENPSKTHSDIASIHGDVFTGIPNDIAAQIIENHNEFQKKLYELTKDLTWNFELLIWEIK